MKNVRKTLILLGASAVLGACATGGDETLRLDRQPQDTLTDKLQARNLRYDGPVDRIRNYRLSGWSYIDSYHVIITAGVRDQYLVTLRTNCHELVGANGIGFTNTVGSLTSSDSLLVKGFGSSFVDRCPIQSIGRLVRTDRPETEAKS